ncbi:hypothetical protein ACCO45_006840 [Purpureocillium lilacinum]|uniref:Uncharacterized protein n=1 Tax=Purpureocillium lilacinum TaxID=33203 RepID=A0ACC4DRF0_PURLI
MTSPTSSRGLSSSRAGATDAQALDGAVVSPYGSGVALRNIVFPDPVAFRFLEDDPSVTVIERQSILRGYELYVVEQWACSRQSPTLVVATYTGDESHSIVVGVLAVPEDENLCGFPSALTVIPVPDGDVRQHRQIFIVNENLKRLGCSGRSGLALTDPTEATQAKFRQLYKISDRIPFLPSVVELVKLCQVALYMFEKLDHEYIDGLLCDVTESAIGNWWTEMGAEHYNFEPTDGILGPTTVAALLGMLLGARNRLNWYGAPVSKDVFDIDSTKRGIAYFQKQHKLEKTRRLDRQTVFRLHTATAKAAAGEARGVQKAVKSTMTEIGGKRGELVMDMVSGKDKGGVADIETLDLDTFVSLAYGERPKWLWHGKPRRATADHVDGVQDTNAVVPGKADTAIQNAKRTQSLPLDEQLDLKKKTTSLSSTPLYLQSRVHDGDIGIDVRQDVLPTTLTRMRSVLDESDLQGPLLDEERNGDGRKLVVSRRHSCGVSDLTYKHITNENRWARHMSFGDAEQAVLAWDEIVDVMDLSGDVECFGARAEEAAHLTRLVDDIVYDMEPWVEEKLRVVETLNERYSRDKTELQKLYHQLNDACQRVRYNSDELLASERASLTEGVKEIEVLVARLEYEIDGLVQKVHDVEDGIQSFERQVEDVERRAEELKVQLETESWLHWFVRTLTGVGTGPNITRTAAR